MQNSKTKCQLVSKAIISGPQTKMIVDYGCPVGTVDFPISSDFQ